MANIVDLLRQYLRPYYNIILIIILLVLFLVIGNYGYKMFYKNVQDNRKFVDVANSNRRNKEVTIFFFHVDWCPHCKTAKPSWQDFKTIYDGKEVNGYIVKCVELNCTDDKDSAVTRAINEYKIESYPTVKMLKDEQTYNFESRISKNSLEQFVNTILT